MIGLEEGILPHSRARQNPDELEEERRLCFVGITRAQERLILTKAAVRTLRGIRERTITSPFLSDMPPEALTIIDRTGAGATSGGGEHSQLDDPATLAGQFKRGQLVRHEQFGLGRIAEVWEAGQHTRAVVQFNQVGRKTLVLQYARLQVVQ
jgi:DNA helicase II / ATP-dependent DNA helicase PcrA